MFFFIIVYQAAPQMTFSLVTEVARVYFLCGPNTPKLEMETVFPIKTNSLSFANTHKSH